MVTDEWYAQFEVVGTVVIQVVPWFICQGEHTESKCTQSAPDTRPRPIQYSVIGLGESEMIRLECHTNSMMKL